MEEAIAEDKDDSRLEKVKERQDHYVAEKIREGDEHREERDEQHDPRPTEENVDAQDRRATGSEEAVIDGEQGDDDMGDETKADRKEEDVLVDLPSSSTDIRLRSPDRKPARKRGSREVSAGARTSAVHEDEPDTKKIILDADDGEAASVKDDDD